MGKLPTVSGADAGGSVTTRTTKPAATSFYETETHPIGAFPCQTTRNSRAELFEPLSERLG